MAQVQKMIRLVSNENFYGCSEKVLETIRRAQPGVHLYPEIDPVKLKQRIAEMFGVGAKNVVVGAGSVRIIDGLIQTFTDESSEVLFFEKSFVAYGQLAKLHKRKCVVAPLDEFRCNPKNLVPLITTYTDLVFIANPNNPTGTIISHSELEEFLEALPGHVIVIADEAYAEYVQDADFPRTIELQKKFSNLVILRSFSKIYGLAGLRIGYAIMHEDLATRLSAGQIPFSLNCLSTDAAIAALEDQDFVRRSSVDNAMQRDFLYHALKEAGYNTIPSHANFIYLWFDSDDKKDIVYKKLLDGGISICDLQVFGQEKALRITVADEEVNRRIVEILS